MGESAGSVIVSPDYEVNYAIGPEALALPSAEARTPRYTDIRDSHIAAGLAVGPLSVMARIQQHPSIQLPGRALSDTLLRVADTHILDWKAAGVGVAAFAAANLGLKVRDHLVSVRPTETIVIPPDAVVSQPHETISTRRGRQVGHKILNLLAATSVGLIGYRLSEQGSVDTDLVASLALIGTAYTRVQASEIKDWAQRRRRLDKPAASDKNLPSVWALRATHALPRGPS